MDSKLIVEAARVAHSGEHGIYNSLTMDPLIHAVGSVMDHLVELDYKLTPVEKAARTKVDRFVISKGGHCTNKACKGYGE